MELVPEKKEAFIVSQEIHAGRKKIPLGSIGCFIKGKHSMGHIVDQKSRPLVALMSGHIKPLSCYQAALLLSIDSPKKRYNLFCDEQLFASICFLKINDMVQLRCGRVMTVGIVRGFWEWLRKPVSGELKMVLIEVELLDPRFPVSNRFSRLKVDMSKITTVSASISISPRYKEMEQNFHKNDPEEFLNVLLGEVLAIESLLKIKAGNEVLEYNCYQVLVEREGMVNMPTVQQLLEESLLSYDLKFAETPSCLILQMPRFGKGFKTFSSVYPTLELDLTSLVDHDPQMCRMYGGQVTYGCSWCHLDSILDPSHMKLWKGIAKKALSHEPRQMHSGIEQKFNSCSTKSQTMELFAVLCIESNHYVAFVRCGASRQSWLFFDSMAGQLQNEKGSHIPVVKACPQLGHYLAMAPEEISAVDIKQMDPFSRRFFCDSYTFMYQPPKFSSDRCQFKS